MNVKKKVDPEKMTIVEAAEWLEGLKLSFEHWIEYFELNGEVTGNASGGFFYRLKGEYR